MEMIFFCVVGFLLGGPFGLLAALVFYAILIARN